jgi:hypothetical protein
LQICAGIFRKFVEVLYSIAVSEKPSFPARVDWNVLAAILSMTWTFVELERKKKLEQEDKEEQERIKWEKTKNLVGGYFGGYYDVTIDLTNLETTWNFTEGIKKKLARSPSVFLQRKVL